MSENIDVRKKASEYRDHLVAELAKVEDFLSTAERLTKMGAVPGLGAELTASDEKPLELH